MHSLSTFDATSTAQDVLTGLDLRGRRMIVTGASSGIGVETTRSLAAAGAAVTLAVRDTDAGHRTVAAIRETTPDADLAVAYLDLLDIASVRSFARSWTGPLHALVNNAGVMANPLTRTAAGWESQFAANHLAHFELTRLLHPALAAADGARVVAVTSAGHQTSGIDFDDPMFVHRPYDPWIAYGQSKTAIALFAVAAAWRWADDGIVVGAVHPGSIMTNLPRHLPEGFAREQGWIDEHGNVSDDFKSVEQGAATSVFVAAHPAAAALSGRYLEDVHVAAPYDPAVPLVGVADHATDAVDAERLWSMSETLLDEV